MAPLTAPYGSWKSPIAAGPFPGISALTGVPVRFDGDDLYWNEMRPHEGGRYVLMRRTKARQTSDVTPPHFNCRTRAHEYGGGAFVVDSGEIYFSHFADGRVYFQTPNTEPKPLTPEAPMYYADFSVDRPRRRLICVREDHTPRGREAVNSLVAIPLAGGAATVLVSGNDFYSNPRLSPDGRRLAWLTWNHPRLPWDGTELWVGDINPDGTLGRTQQVAGGPDESLFQPEWSPDGELYFVSDRSDWWNLYRWRAGQVEAVCPLEAEFGRPQWIFGFRTYAFESAERILCAYNQRGAWTLARLNTRTGQLEPLELPFTYFQSIATTAGRAAFNAASPTTHPCVAVVDLATGKVETARRLVRVDIDPGYLSVPRAVEFPTEGGLTAHAWFYPPQNKDYAAPGREKPPLIVQSHGGPTGQSLNVLDFAIQFWTSRGFAFLDVNYGGSSGYGRAFRRRLYGAWGVMDMDDCCNAARHLAKLKEVDAKRMAITGGSAGGYTTLCALTFRDTFAAGGSHFGISDLEVFVRDTHKFEARYLDELVGPYPARQDLYHDRSPLHFLKQLNRPMILFQGLDDKIVPPNQAELMFAAVKAKGLPVAYLPFAGEQHGFRRTENIKRALEGELYFYSRIFAFELADPVEPVKIENLSAVGRKPRAARAARPRPAAGAKAKKAGKKS
jgi:dipeptidyl aminopeptidase/acylaminoacyl peptidase